MDKSKLAFVSSSVQIKELGQAWVRSPKPCESIWWGRSSSSSSSQRGELRPLDSWEGASHSEWSRCSHGQQPWCSENAESHTGDVGVGGGVPPPGSAYESMPRVATVHNPSHKPLLSSHFTPPFNNNYYYDLLLFIVYPSLLWRL